MGATTQTQATGTETSPEGTPPPVLDDRLTRLNRWIAVFATSVSSAAIIILMLHVVVNVFSRKVFNHPLPTTLEVTQYWYMPVLALLGIVGAQVARENLRADLIFGRFPPAARKWVSLGTHVLCTVVSLGFAWFSFTSALENSRIGQTAGISNLPIWPIAYVVPLAFLLLAVVYVTQMFLPGLAKPDTLEDELAAAEEEAADITTESIPVHRKTETTATAPTQSIAGSKGWPVTIILLVLAVGSAVTMFADLPKEAVGSIGLVLMLALLFLRVPVAVSLIVPSILGIGAIRGFRPVEGLLSEIALSATASWSLTVIPMFVFMGLLVWRAGVTSDLYRAARDWLHWLPGGLAVGTNAAGSALSAVSGSTIGQVYALGRIGVPEMLRTGYKPRYTVAAVISSGLTGQLIPPSIMLVIYAGLVEVSVGHQLIAGVVPGLLILAMLSVLFVVLAIVKPELVGKGPKAVIPPNAGSLERSENRWLSLLRTWPVVLLIVLIIFGMFSGWVTATEVGAAAAFFAALLALGRIRGVKGLKTIGIAAMDTARSAGAIFFLVIGGFSLTRMLTLSGVSKGLAEGIIAANFTPIAFMLVMMVVYLIMGMFLDPLAMMLLTVPILLPTLDAMDIPLLWFGVFIAFLGELAIVTPPVGILSYIVHGIVQDKEVSFGMRITLRDVFTGVAWILPVAVLFLIILILFPQLATFLPDLMTANPG